MLVMTLYCSSLLDYCNYPLEYFQGLWSRSRSHFTQPPIQYHTKAYNKISAVFAIFILLLVKR